MFNEVKEAIAYIESRFVPRKVEEYQEILDRNHIALKNPNIIHVTGTNGKGSTIHYLCQFLMKAGKNVGTFTSPYLISYHDRFCVNGIPIDDQSLLSIVNDNYELIERENLSKFEIDILIMIQYFNSLDLDYIIVEVGVGGKEDKTNVITSKTAVIVNIGKDHLPRLGKDIYDICNHKMGIIKADSQVFTSVIQPKCIEMIKEKVNQTNSSLTIVNNIEDFDYGRLPEYQKKNISLAYQIYLSLDHSLTKQLIQEVIDSTFWKGRFERFYGDDHEVIIDGAHNEDGIHALLEALEKQKEDYIIVFSALRDKDYPMMIHLLEEHYRVLVTVFEDERKMQLEDLKDFKEVYPTFDEAFQEAMKQKHIVVTGSLHFISFVRNYLLERGLK